MKGALAIAFAAGTLLGGVGAWLLMAPGVVPERGEGPVPSPPHPARPSPAQVSTGEQPGSSHDVAATREATPHLERRISELEADLVATKKEARRNLVKGALVFELDGRTPEEILKRIQDVEPEQGTVRFGSNPEQFASMAWMYLQKIVPEDFDEALQRCLDHDLQWTNSCDLQPEEVQMVRDYTEKAYRLMVSLQQRSATVRRWLADEGALTPEERARLKKAFDGLDDHRIYVRSYAPSFILPKLFPKEPLKK